MARMPDWAKFGLDSGEREPLRAAEVKPDGSEGGTNGNNHGSLLESGGADTSPGPSGGGARSKPQLFGGQVQNESELFADDQGSRAPPWWLSHFLVSEKVLFGTWDGVFTSCLINIFGVIVFLRSGWIVAEAGIGHSILIVLSAVLLILIAVLAAIGICERCHVQSGGVYFLIAHVLGSRHGAAVGIVYVFGQAIGNALCATGFAESIAGLLAKDHSPLIERLIAGLVIVLLTLVNLAGVKWVIRLQFALLVILLAGAADFFLGSFTHSDHEHGFTGYNATVWHANAHPKYTEGQNWFSVFGVFFPALTGVMAGINMSGDLKNPSRDISVGTLSAVTVGSFLYMLFLVVLGATCDREALLNDYMIAEKVSLFGFFLLSALYISSISSCLATLFGTPRVLQSIASENVIPAIARLSEGTGPNKVPINALVTISAVTLFFIAVGDMNRLAIITTMPFLITYAVIEYAYFALCMQFDLNQQRLQHFKAHGMPTPTFEENKSLTLNGGGGAKHKRNASAGNSSVASDDTAASHDSQGGTKKKGRDEEFEELLEKYHVDEIEDKQRNFYSAFCSRWLSLTGAILKIILMFLINWTYSVLCLVFTIGIWFYIGQGAPGANLGVAAEFSIIEFVKRIFARITGGQAPITKDEKLVINQPQPVLTTRSSHLNEVNTDFADRSQFHQAHTVQGSHFKD